VWRTCATTSASVQVDPLDGLKAEGARHVKVIDIIATATTCSPQLLAQGFSVGRMDSADRYLALWQRGTSAVPWDLGEATHGPRILSPRTLDGRAATSHRVREPDRDESGG
jgi:hypothetical protein